MRRGGGIFCIKVQLCVQCCSIIVLSQSLPIIWHTTYSSDMFSSLDLRSRYLNIWNGTCQCPTVRACVTTVVSKVKTTVFGLDVHWTGSPPDLLTWSRQARFPNCHECPVASGLGNLTSLDMHSGRRDWRPQISQFYKFQWCLKNQIQQAIESWDLWCYDEVVRNG